MWEDEAPDPDEDDISQWTPTRRLRGTSMFTISASTIRRPAGRDFPVEDPDIAEVVSDFETLLTNIVGAQPNARGREFPGGPLFGNFLFPSELGPPDRPGPSQDFPGGGRTTRATARLFAGEDRGPQIQTGNIHE